MSNQVPAHVDAAVNSASLIAGMRPDARRHPMFPTVADQVLKMLSVAVTFIHQVTGKDVIGPNDTASEMVSKVRHEIYKISYPSKPGEVQEHRGKI